MTAEDASNLAEECMRLSEQLIAYREAVAEAVALLGHTGCEPEDLRDAIGQLERLLAGKDLDRNDLRGFAEQVRGLICEACSA